MRSQGARVACAVQDAHNHKLALVMQVIDGELPEKAARSPEQPAGARRDGNGRNSFGCLFNCRQVACAVHDSHNLRAVFGNAIESKPTLDDDRARFRLDFGAGSAKVVEQCAGLLDAVIDAIVSVRRWVSGRLTASSLGR